MGADAARAPQVADGDAERRPDPHPRRLDAVVTDQALHGPGPAGWFHLSLLLKLLLFAGGAVLVISCTDGVGSVLDLPSWWSEPIVYQKFVVWTLLWEILGLGGGSLRPGASRWPILGGARYWLRPGTIRIAAWPTRVLFTRGTTRTIVDVALYVVVLGIAGWLLGFTGSTSRALPFTGILALLEVLALLGLRDRTVFLAARPERYAVMLAVFLLPVEHQIFALKLVLVALWWSAATARLTRHVPFALSVLISNAPWGGPLRRRFWRGPSDLRPSRLSRRVAHTGTALLYLVPLVLLLSDGGVVTTVGVTVMVMLAVLAAATFPSGGSLEGAVFTGYATLFLFGHYAAIGAGSIGAAVLAALPAAAVLGLSVLGVLAPKWVLVPASLRSGSGNEASSMWLVRDDAQEEFADAVDAVHPLRRRRSVPAAAGHDAARYRALAFRSLHAHGRALNGLRCRAAEDPTRYTAHDGALITGVTLGWTTGDEQHHALRLFEAVAQRSEVEAGQLRVITVGSQPIHRGEQRYRIIDAVDGVIEEGLIDVDDLVRRRHWSTAEDATVPVEVLFNRSGFAGYTAPADFAFLADRTSAPWHGIDDVPEYADASPEPAVTPAKPRPRPAARPTPTRVVSVASANPVRSVTGAVPPLATQLADANDANGSAQPGAASVVARTPRPAASDGDRGAARPRPRRVSPRPS